jgi:hypothetical protein
VFGRLPTTRVDATDFDAVDERPEGLWLQNVERSALVPWETVILVEGTE